MKCSLPILLAVLAIACSSEPKQSTSSDAKIESEVSAVVKNLVDSGKIAGVAVGVFKDNQPLVLKGYGFADLEYDIPLAADASFEIGSVTKQFTTAAILQLVEAGKINLDDEIGKYLTFDTQGKKVTVRQLMNHTSGIKGYTELPMFESLAVMKHKRDTLLRLVEKEPFDFEPGDALIYNNTGFFMLGLIIEKASGLSYEEYIQKNLFDKAGMTHSYYCSENKIVKNRAHGYEMGKEGLVRASYLDHTWPYAAGSICSTVADLAKWNDALHHGKIISDAMYREYLAPAVLNDGTVTHYAKGITIQNKNGRRLIEHGGAINGFFAENMYFPDENLTVVVLMNTAGPTRTSVVEKPIVDLLFPNPEMEKATFTGDLKTLTGKYSGRARGSDIEVTVAADNGTLTVQRGEDKPTKLEYVKDNTWTDGYGTYEFRGKELRVDQVYGYYKLIRIEN